jgi:hypothetical protein
MHPKLGEMMNGVYVVRVIWGTFLITFVTNKT